MHDIYQTSVKVLIVSCSTSSESQSHKSINNNTQTYLDNTTTPLPTSNNQSIFQLIERQVHYLTRVLLCSSVLHISTTHNTMCCSDRPSRRERRRLVAAERAAIDLLATQRQSEKYMQPTPYPASSGRSVKDSPPPYGAIDQIKGEKDSRLSIPRTPSERSMVSSTLSQPASYVSGQSPMILVPASPECAQHGHQVSRLSSCQVKRPDIFLLPCPSSL